MVSIIILSYNTEKLLHECLKSLFSTLSTPFEVIVLDNASSDSSVTMVKREFPKVQLIQSEQNLGFAKGINTASRKAKGKQLLFLNSDAMVLDDHLKDMVSVMEADPSVAVIGGNLLQRDNATSDAFGSFYNLPEVVRLLFFRRKSRPRLVDPLSRVDWVSGGYMLVSKEIFEKLLGFDERFFMYIEDMEFCYRVRALGKSVYYYASAQAKHVGQGSSNRTFAIVNIYRGLLLFYKKHKPIWEYFVVQLLLLLKAGIGYLAGVLTNNTYLRSTYAQAFKVIV